MKTLHQVKNYIALLAFVAATVAIIGSVHVANKPNTVKENSKEQYVYLPGNTANGVQDLKSIYELIGKYRIRKQGDYPATMSNLIEDIVVNLENYGLHEDLDLRDKLSNPDVQYSDNPAERRSPRVVVPYVINGRRPDGTEVGTPKPIGTRDVLCYTDLYVYRGERANTSRQFYNPRGYYLVLWDDGQVEKVPFDRSLNVVVAGTFYDASFIGQPGMPPNIVTYEEQGQFAIGNEPLLIGKPLIEGRFVVDNGAPESLVKLSRLLNFPDRNGIAREDLWRTFSPSQETFAPKQVREGAAKLNLPLQSKKLTLAQLTTLRSPAILQMRGDIIAQNPLNPRPSGATSTVPVTISTNRIVTLAQSGIEYSIVQDAGMTRVVRNVELAKLYSGEALLPQAANAPSALKIDNPVRVVPFQTKSDEVVQTVTLTNAGKTPLTLEIERPLPGVTKAELSSKTLQAGASATLTLNIKWREVLPGDVQQVFVTLKTSDPIQPRAMLGFRLEVPPAPPLNASPDSGAKPPVLP